MMATIKKQPELLNHLSETSITSYNNLNDKTSPINGLLLFNHPQVNQSTEVNNNSNNNSDDVKSSPINGKMTLPLALGASLAMLLGSIPSGYNVGVVNTPQLVLESFCNDTLNERSISISSNNLGLLWSVCVSALLLGAILATNFSNQLANWIGRKGALLTSGIFGIVGSILFFGSYYSRFVEIFILARFIAGIHSGLTSGLVPLYIAEIAPESLKGAMGVLHTTGLNFGMLLGQILGQETLLGTHIYWPLLLALSMIFIILGLAIYKFSPSSPLYLYIIKKKYSKATDELANIRRSSISKMDGEIAALKKEHKEQESYKSNWTFLSVLQSSDYRGKVLLVILIHTGQQFSGINAVLYYSTATFFQLGMTMQQAQYGSIALGLINFITCFIAMPLLKKWRRRSLLFLSIWGQVFFLIGLTITIKIKDSYPWVSVITVIMFLAFAFMFGIGNGSIPWLIPAELLPQATLGAVMGIGGLINWLGNFAVALSFPVLNNLLGDSVFLAYVAFCSVEGIILFIYLPETNTALKTISTDTMLTPPSSSSSNKTSTTASTPSSPLSKSIDSQQDIQNNFNSIVVED